MEIIHHNTSGCYAVIFTAIQTDDTDGYAEASILLREKLKGFPGFIGIEAVEDKQGNEITVSYWKDAESIKRWKMDEDHAAIKSQNKYKWYSGYKVRVAKIEREYEMDKLVSH